MGQVDDGSAIAATAHVVLAVTHRDPAPATARSVALGLALTGGGAIGFHLARVAAA